MIDSCIHQFHILLFIIVRIQKVCVVLFYFCFFTYSCGRWLAKDLAVTVGGREFLQESQGNTFAKSIFPRTCTSTAQIGNERREVQKSISHTTVPALYGSGITMLKPIFHSLH
jgi:hypothetical protein